MRASRRFFFALLPLGLGLGGCAALQDSTPVPIAHVSTKVVQICHGYNCRRKARYDIGADRARFAAIMAAGKSSPAAERAAIGRAEMFYEDQVSKVIGVRDKAGAAQGDSGKVGQMDCIDELTNTHTLLVYLAENEWLKYHRVLPNVSRGFFFDGRYPHATAVVSEISTGKDWAVDSWFGPAGAPPDILPLNKWMSYGVFGERYGHDGPPRKSGDG